MKTIDWVEQADRFWAGELGVAPSMLRTAGFHVFERADANTQARATVVGTSSATIVSLPKGRTRAFENAGLRLGEMERWPRPYVASCSSIRSLEVRGPALLAYWPPFTQVSPREQTELLTGDSLASPRRSAILLLPSGKKQASGPSHEFSACASEIELLR